MYIDLYCWSYTLSSVFSLLRESFWSLSSMSLIKFCTISVLLFTGSYMDVRWRSDTTERLHFHFLLSCLGEGKGNSLQCSYLENPRDRGAWWAAIYGVAQSRTQLKWLSSSSSSSIWMLIMQIPFLPLKISSFLSYLTLVFLMLSFHPFLLNWFILLSFYIFLFSMNFCFSLRNHDFLTSPEVQNFLKFSSES